MSAIAIQATDSALDAAVLALTGLVESQRSGDVNYFHNQLPRYARTIKRIQELRPAPCKVLDVGSHYLHQSVLLAKLGYQVTGIDIDLFTTVDFVSQRAKAFGIDNLTVNALEMGDFLHGQEGQFDVVVFTEILEHITFNPVRFWRRIHELLSPGGIIYLSTPNSLRPAAWLRQLRSLLLGQGVGLSLDGIFGTVTYGHHWKEYSAWEVKRYFALLSSDFTVQTHWYSTDNTTVRSAKSLLKAALSMVPHWRSDIEAVISRNGQGGFLLQAPSLPLQNRASAAQTSGQPTTPNNND
jgi:2-polyprenyl-3-methyl-5-hydroxy-6-metoxy-1,4-benzoquinol methylase